jgi:glutathione peroxidase
MAETFFDFEVKDSTNQNFSLSQYKGKYVLVVNVASKCGFTPQYDGLEKMFQNLKDKNVVVLGFPCNQFGAQEPGSNDEIQSFCRLNYGVSFPILNKVDVNGDDANPVFKHLKSKAPGLLGTEMIKWNFTKFLVGPNGEVLKRYAPQDKPEDIEKEILKLLQS